VAVPSPFNTASLEQKLAGRVGGALHTIDDDALGAGRDGRVASVVDPAACAGPIADVRAS